MISQRIGSMSFEEAIQVLSEVAHLLNEATTLYRRQQATVMAHDNTRAFLGGSTILHRIVSDNSILFPTMIRDEFENLMRIVDIGGSDLISLTNGDHGDNVLHLVMKHWAKDDEFKVTSRMYINYLHFVSMLVHNCERSALLARNHRNLRPLDCAPMPILDKEPFLLRPPTVMDKVKKLSPSVDLICNATASAENRSKVHTAIEWGLKWNIGLGTIVAESHLDETANYVDPETNLNLFMLAARKQSNVFLDKCDLKTVYELAMINVNAISQCIGWE
jgi:hypothetical protein